jgi:hypothetical protein
MGESDVKPIRSRRRKKHPYRQFILILVAASVIIGAIFLMLFLRRPAPPSGFNVSGDDPSVQFK